MKDVVLNIISVQNGREVSNVSTVAQMKKTSDGYNFLFEDLNGDLTDNVNMRISITPKGLRIFSGKRKESADIVLEEGNKHFCLFEKNKDKDLTVGIQTYAVSSDLGDNGGNFEVEYLMDYNCEHVTKNKMCVSVKPSNMKR